MKAIACAIMFGIIWHTPLPLWNEFTETGKGIIIAVSMVMFIGFFGFLGGEKS